jgi:hypothetical protein
MDADDADAALILADFFSDPIDLRPSALYQRKSAS